MEEAREDGETTWLLVDGAGFRVAGPFLLREAAAKDYVRVKVRDVSEID